MERRVRMSGLGLLVLLAVTVGVRGDPWRCDQLAGFLDDLLPDITPMMSVSRYQLDLMEAYTGYDLRAPEGRHQLACAIIDAVDLNSFSNTTGVPYLRVYYLNQLLQSGLDASGGLDQYFHFLMGVHLYLDELSEWAERTGFPDVPVNTTYHDALEFFQHLDAAYSDDVLTEIAYRMPYFNQLSPEELAEAVTESQTDRELMDSLHASSWSLSFIRDRLRTYMVTSTEARAYSALTVAHKTDLLPFAYTGSPYDDMHISDENDTCHDIHELMLAALEESQNAELRMFAGVFYLSQGLDLDLLNPDVIRELACNISACQNLTDLASVLGLSMEQIMREKRNIVMTVAMAFGGVIGMERTISLYESVLDFSDQTGFPTFPLHDVTVDGVEAFIQGLSDLMELRDGRMDGRFVRAILPINTMRPKDIALAMTEANSFESCYRRLYPNGDLGYHTPQEDDVIHVIETEMPNARQLLSLASRAVTIAIDMGFMEYIGPEAK